MVKIDIKTDTEPKPNYIISLLINICIGMIMAGFIFIGMVIGSFSYEYEYFDLHKSITFNSLVKHYKTNNLDLINTSLINGIDSSNYDLKSFHTYIKSIYFYERGTYDCKYWSLIWSLYLLKHNIDFRYIILDNHISVLIELDNMYCIADNDILQCFYLG